MSTDLLPADIFFTRGRGMLSRLIRFFSRGIGESRTQVNHVGIVTKAGGATTAVVVEALLKVVEHPLIEQYGGKTDEVAVYRHINLTGDQQRTIVAAAEAYVGRKYGWSTLAMHVLDWCLLGAYVFRRLGSDKYPICSWVVAHAYAKVDATFGVPTSAADPDDIWDFVTRNPGKYALVRPLSILMRR